MARLIGWGILMGLAASPVVLLWNFATAAGL